MALLVETTTPQFTTLQFRAVREALAVLLEPVVIPVQRELQELAVRAVPAQQGRQGQEVAF
jgi:hypothetical protein